VGAPEVVKALGFEALDRRALRYVEKQSRIATSELVDSQAEQQRLEELLEASKPAVPRQAQGLDWLLRSAFRYPPLRYGSRFGSAAERGILYLSETRRALEAELAFYAFKFYEGMSEPPPRPLRRELTVITLRLRTQAGLDLGRLEDAVLRPLVDPESWRFSQRFGRCAREAGAAAIRYPSARIAWPAARMHRNLAVLAPEAVAGNGHPRASGSYLVLTDAEGVRLQGDMKPTRYVPAEQLRGGPF
jgi:hypothetical protein